ncbi:MAG: hypothetical protein ACXACX_18705 [Candidatus Hodarchaeales archaeon]|jgi:hypothetical protein
MKKENMKLKIKKFLFIITVLVITSIYTIPLMNTSNNDYSPPTVENNFPEVAQIETVALKPDGDVANEWNDGAPTPHSDYVDEDPDDPDDQNVIEITDSNIYEIYTFDSTSIAGGTITQIRVKIRFFNLGGTPRVYLDFGGIQYWEDLIPNPVAAEDYIFPDLNGDQADLDGLKIGFKSSIATGMVKINSLSAVEVYATYEPFVPVSRPSEDVTIQWMPAGVTHCEKLDDDVYEPDSGDSDYILAGWGDTGKIDEFEMDNNIQDERDVAEIQIKTFGRRVGTGRPQVSIYWNGIWQPWKIVSVPGGLSPWPVVPSNWTTDTWTLEGDQHDLNNLKVKYKANVQNVPYGLNLIDAFYCTVTFNTIIINSPGDGASYSEPMEGYYPASYGFEDEEDETSRLDINFIDSVSTYGTCEIKGSYSDTNNKLHKKILHVEDSSTSSVMEFKHDIYIPEGQLGSIEFWFLMTDKYTEDFDEVLIYTTDDQDNLIFQLAMHDGKFIDLEGNYATMTYNKWYHIRIHFSSLSTSAYYDWYLNDELQYSNVACAKDMSYITDLVIHGDSISKGEAYFDAFSFSWDDYYGLKDNHQEGLLLDIESEVLDEMWYVLDGDEERKVYISGDTVLPMPFTEYHTIKVRGTLDGQDHESSTIDFSYNVPDKYAMMFWSSEMDGPWVEEYSAILENKGFTIFKSEMDVNNLQITLWFIELALIMDSDDIFFLYIKGHGVYESGESWIYLHPEYFTTSSDFLSNMEWLPNEEKMIVADTCYSGTFAYDRPSYVSIAAAKIDEKAYNSFGPQFFLPLGDGFNAYQSFFKAKDSALHSLPPYAPQLSYRSDINYFSY